ncbi:MAG: EAL domain-containing protein [Geobacter sp.]|nr:EAL domain-containing protein [Geobacter sp.]
MTTEAKTRRQLLDENSVLKGRIQELEMIDQVRNEEIQIMVKAAFHDAITGLPNKDLFYDHLCQAQALAKRNQSLTAVVFFTLDRLKLINDSLGHAAGDLLLKQVAGRLKAALRESDILARPGRDEFIILLPQVNSLLDATLVAERIFTSLQTSFTIDNHELVITGNIGISLSPNYTVTADVLIKNAYNAMQRAKEAGPNQYRTYRALDIEADFDSLLMENSLRLALQKNEFYLHYQPQVNLLEGRVVGIESLLRWQHPKLGSIAPTDFIPIIERIGLIEPLSEWVLREACTQNKRLQQSGHPPLKVAVNLSSSQLHQPHFLQTVTKILKETGLDGRFLEIEITESALAKNITETATTLAALANIGVHIAIDDFGTGYSSLAYLSNFKIDNLKIDKSFVDSITSNTSNASISRAIIALAHSLGLRVIAEGVETREQLSFLHSLSCDDVQGYLLSYPLAFADLEQFIAANTRANGIFSGSIKGYDGNILWPASPAPEAFGH